MRQPGRGCREHLSGATVVALLVALSAGVAAADWQFFGLSYLTGALGYRVDSLTQQTPASSSQTLSGDKTLDLRLGAYLFHPLFLSLDADTSLTAFPEDPLGVVSNRNSGLSFTLLSGKPVSGGGSGRMKVETVKQSFSPDYERKVDALGGWLLFRRGAALANLHFDQEATRAAEAPLPEDRDRVTRTLGIDSTLQLPVFGASTLRGKQVDQDDRETNRDVQYQSVEMVSGNAFLGDRVRLNTVVNASQRTLPSPATKYLVSASTAIRHSDTLRSSLRVETNQIDEDLIRYGFQRFDGGLEKVLNPVWSVGTGLAATRSHTDLMGADTLRWSGRASFQRELPGGYLASGSNEVSYEYVSSSGRVAIRDEAHQFPALVPDVITLGNTGVDLATIRVTNETGTIIYHEGPAYTVSENPVSRAVQLTRGSNPDNLNDPDHIPQLGKVLVSYECVLPGNRYSTVGNLLSLRAGREFQPGRGLESSLQVKNSTTLVQEGPSAPLPPEFRYDLTLSGYVKERERELEGGVSVGESRVALHGSAKAPWRGWEFSERYYGNFYSDLTGHSFETTASYTLGLTEKEHADLVVIDRTYLANGRTDQALTTVGIGYLRLFDPMMRLDTNARYEWNRVVKDDHRLNFGTKFSWQQGQLSLTAGYEYKIRLFDQYTSHHVYVTAKRWF